MMKRTFDVSPWHIVTTKLNPDDKRLQESMTSLANGNLGMRGFFEEGYSGDTLPGIYIGGVWFPDKTKVGWCPIHHFDQRTFRCQHGLVPWSIQRKYLFTTNRCFSIEFRFVPIDGLINARDGSLSRYLDVSRCLLSKQY